MVQKSTWYDEWHLISLIVNALDMDNVGLCFMVVSRQSMRKNKERIRDIGAPNYRPLNPDPYP